jgi:hypothetical protein
MQTSPLSYGLRWREITAEQILRHRAFVITAVGRPKSFIDFVIRSASLIASADMRETGPRPHTSYPWRDHAGMMRLAGSYR